MRHAVTCTASPSSSCICNKHTAGAGGGSLPAGLGDTPYCKLYPASSICPQLELSIWAQAPGLDPFRPDQATPVPNFFLAGSYTKQDYIDSMEGATLSGRQCAGAVVAAAPKLAAST